MTRYHIENEGHRGKAFKVRGGLRVVPARSAADIDDAAPLTEAQIAALAADRCKVEEMDGTDAPDIARLTVEELKDLAAKEEIDLGDATKKADIVSAIQMGREARA
jgi:hypothetical protein